MAADSTRKPAKQVVRRKVARVLTTALTQANWNASKTYGVWNEASSHAEAKEIYANMASQASKAPESVLAEKRRATTRDGQKYMSKVKAGLNKMEYFMETMDRKSKIQQLDLQNKKLRIELKKVRTKFLDLEFKHRVKEVDEDEEDFESQNREAEEARAYVGVDADLSERPDHQGSHRRAEALADQAEVRARRPETRPKGNQRVRASRHHQEA